MKHNHLIKTLLIGAFVGVSGMASATSESSQEPGIPYHEGNPDYSRALIDGEAGSGGTSIRYTSFSASGMSTLRNSDTYSYGGGGCISATAASGYLGLDQNLDLPHDTKLVSVSYLVNDNNASASTNGLLFSGGEIFTQFGTDSTTAPETPGFTTLGTYLDYTIDVSTEFITARLELFDGDGTTAELCGVRIGYIPPSVASDVIFADDFYR